MFDHFRGRLILIKRRTLFIGLILFAGILIFLMVKSSDADKSGNHHYLKLPDPQQFGGLPLMDALNHRQSSRNFSIEKLPIQTLSNLLWAGYGINRDDGKRTAPSCMNWQGIEIYVLGENGSYVYHPKINTLQFVTDEDIRGYASKQDIVKIAPINLVYVADFSKIQGYSHQKAMTVYAETGCIAQNVYLFCASEGLNCVLLGNIDRLELHKQLALRKEQKVILTQPIGFPPEKNITPNQM